MKPSVCWLRWFVAWAVLAFVSGGCVTPLTLEQQSDWNWKQYNPDYRTPYPTDPGWGSR
ncbi:MAG TPA: hypothetical protein VI136_06165 [Verrucomicrobiae bacterium]